MTKEEIELLYDLRIEGYGPTKISREMGISVNTIISYLRRHPDPPGRIACRECGTYVKCVPDMLTVYLKSA